MSVIDFGAHLPAFAHFSAKRSGGGANGRLSILREQRVHRAPVDPSIWWRARRAGSGQQVKRRLEVSAVVQSAASRRNSLLCGEFAGDRRQAEAIILGFAWSPEFVGN